MSSRTVSFYKKGYRVMTTEKKKISRREFLIKAGLVSGGALLAACAPQIETVVVTQPAQVQTQLVTSVVTQQVTKQVTQQVTQQVLVTATPKAPPGGKLVLE